MAPAEHEERRPLDPTRRLLRVFGVGVSNFEERTAALLERAEATDDPRELLRLAGEAVEQTAELNARLREMTAHVLEAQEQALARLQAAMQKAQH